MNMNRLHVRRIVTVREELPANGDGRSGDSLVRTAGIVIIENPFLGMKKGDDLSDYFPLGETIGNLVIHDMVEMLPSSACAYGKATLVGQSGNPEHGAALMHPTLGKPIRAALNGGKAIIPSNVKVGPMGASIDVPLSHKDDAWSFDHLDTITVSVSGSPRADEIMVIVALSTGTRATVCQN
ncbi:hypothetical protein J2T57_000499 [Natronocella acetinitrilica]|uniref:Amino acid synthesis family protein n=1 Tax=Natronocella acetinitrilica TaxID=414046 RepID=A0AAE3G3T8_9GAMM|nr:amino acid synthesis family protein [Natronocella acetinitrilica]MCP1673407.1 hypothetical protein [Natronocella acetinitrilica]